MFYDEISVALPIHAPTFSGLKKNGAILITHCQYGPGRAAADATPGRGKNKHLPS